MPSLIQRVERLEWRLDALEGKAKDPVVDDDTLRAICELRDKIILLTRAVVALCNHPGMNRLPPSQYRNKCIARDHDACACKTCLLPMIVRNSGRAP